MEGAPAVTFIQYTTRGDSSVLKLVKSELGPTRKAGQVLIDNKASSVNPVDYKLREGFGWLATPRLPTTPGGDVAGVVLEADAGSKFKPGDRVMGLLAGFIGGYSNRVVLPETVLARIPDTLSFEQAATLPLAALTAWQGLEMARVQAGNRVLIHAGAGGVGSFAIQLAKARGLQVVTTCSGRNADCVRELGADEVIDYTQQRFEEVLKDRPVHAVLDTIVHGGQPYEYQQRSMKVLKAGGTYINFFPKFEILPIVFGFLRGALGLGPRYRAVVVAPNGTQLEAIAELVAAGKVKPIIHSVFPLEKAAEAQDQVATGHTRGKVVIKIAE